MKTCSRKLAGVVLMVLWCMVPSVDTVSAANGTVSFDVPDTIPADMARDVTGDLQAFIDGVPDHSVIKFPQGAEYLIEGTLKISDREGLTIEGNGSLFRSFDKVTEGGRLDIRNRAHWRVNRGSRHIVLRDLHVRGPNDDAGVGREGWDAAREAQHAFDIDGASHVTLERVSGSYVFGDGVYVRSDHVVVRDSRFHHIGRQGLAIANARDVLVEGNDVREVRRGIFNIEQYGASWASDNVRILNNTTGRSRLLWMPVSGQGVAGSILVAGNVMEASTGIPVIVNRGTAAGRRGPFVAVNNHFVVGGSPAPAFNFADIDGLLFAGNSAVFPAQRAMTAIRASNCKGVLVSGNRFEDAKTNVDFDDDTDGLTGTHGERAAVDLIEIPGGYGVEIMTPEGRVLAVWRMGQTEPPVETLAAFDLETTATMVMVQLDADDEQMVSSQMIGDGIIIFRGKTVMP